MSINGDHPSHQPNSLLLDDLTRMETMVVEKKKKVQKKLVWKQDIPYAWTTHCLKYSIESTPIHRGDRDPVPLTTSNMKHGESQTQVYIADSNV